jgi:hypothetical protein
MCHAFGLYTTGRGWIIPVEPPCWVLRVYSAICMARVGFLNRDIFSFVFRRRPICMGGTITGCNIATAVLYILYKEHKIAFTHKEHVFSRFVRDLITLKC